MSTAAGECILSWLDGAITIREEAARRACAGLSGRWYSGARTDDPHAEDWELESDVVYDEDKPDSVVVNNDVWPSKDRSVHIALNDPASALRRCAADRKILELHQGMPDHGRYSEPECPDDCDGQHNGPLVCMACRSYSGDPLSAPCFTIRFLAEGYGWTGGDR